MKELIMSQFYLSNMNSFLFQEDKLPADIRAQSRHHEFNMFTNQPPTSKYLNEAFPELYSHTHVEPEHITKLESIQNDPCIFNLEGFHEIPQHKGTTAEEVLEASRIIRKYCKTQLIPLRRFLMEFKEYATRCDLKNTVNNVATYIKRKMLQAELDIVKNCPTSFNFLEPTDVYQGQDILITDSIDFLKAKPVDYAPINDVKLNDSCAAFFKSFNAKYLENSWKLDKTASYSPLNDNSLYISNEKLKSRSVESLPQCNDKINIKSPDSRLLSAHLMNLQEMAKLRRI